MAHTRWKSNARTSMAVGEGTITEQVRMDVTGEAKKTTSGYITW